jgi:hypothetical protein
MGVGVVGSRGGFRVILDGKDWKFFVANAFHRPVVQIEMGDLQAGRPRHTGGVAFEGKSMVLGGD